MPKLWIKVKESFNTGPLYVRNNKTGKTPALVGKKAMKLLSEADPLQLGFEVIWFDEDGDGLTFPFAKSGGIKGAILDVKLNPELNGLKITIDGEFQVKLRSGAAPYLQKCGANLDLRISGATYKGGFWAGFTANVKKGAKEIVDPYAAENKDLLPRILEASLK